MEWFSLLAVSGAYLAGLGFLFWVPIARANSPYKFSVGDVGIVFAAGVLIHYIYSLSQKNWGEQPYFVVLAIAGWLWFGAVFFLQRKKFSFPHVRAGWVALFFFLVALYLGKIAFDPLWAHDARSIWFFAAKILYYAHGFGDAAVWKFPDNYLYHFDYPKLIAVHAAHIATLAGAWNEYLPKLSLFWLFFPALCFIWEYSKTKTVRLFLLAAILGIPGSMLWTGYMDGYFAVYAALGVLFALRQASPRDQQISILSFMVLVSLKQEGAIFLFTFLFAAVVRERAWRRYLPYLAAFVPALLWGIMRRRLELTPWPDFFAGDVFDRVRERVITGELFKPILSSLFWDGKILFALVPLVICFGLGKRYKRRIPREAVLPLLVAAAYGAVLVCTYLCTPLDVQFHVSQSVERTAEPIVFLVLLPVVLWLRDPS